MSIFKIFRKRNQSPLKQADQPREEPGAVYIRKALTVAPESGGTLLGRFQERGVFREVKQESEIKGLQEGWKLVDIDKGVRRTYADLTFNQCYTIYRRNSTFRACVETIVRQVSTTPWEIRPSGRDEFNPDHAAEVESFLRNPNVNDENFQQLVSKVVRDLLIYDAGVIEKVFSLGKPRRLKELWARDGSSFKPIIDEHGVVKGYIQAITTREPERVRFEADEIVYIMMHPQTRTPYGMPIAESIVDEISTLIFSSRRIADLMDKDEIPPGVLWIKRLGETQKRRMEEEFKAKRGKELVLRILYNVDEVNWLPFKRSFKDEDVKELIQHVERIIYRNFGLMPSEMGDVEGVVRATALAQMKFARSSLWRPILYLLQYFINTEIIPEFNYSDIEFCFIMPEEEDIEKKARAITNLVRWKVLTINEARAQFPEFRLKPVEGGDIFLDISAKTGEIRAVVPSPQELPKKEEKIDTPEPVTRSKEVFPREICQEIEKQVEGRNVTLSAWQARDVITDLADEMRLYWQKAMKRCQRIFRRFWDREERKIRSENEADAITQVIEIIDRMISSWTGLFKKHYPALVEIGIEGAARVLARPIDVTKDWRKEIVTKFVSEQEAFLREYLGSDLKNRLSALVYGIPYKPRRARTMPARIVKQDDEDPEDIIRSSFDKESFRINDYAARGWAVCNFSFVQGIWTEEPGRKILWRTTSGERTCPTCAKRERESQAEPYSKATLPGVPGDGSTECRARCYCWLEIIE